MSRRKISSESFSSLGSDYLETSPEEEGECPLARLCWNGSRSPPGPPQPRAAAAAAPTPAASAAAAAATAGARRAQRRRRVNLDSLGQSISRLTAPSVSWAEEGRPRERAGERESWRRAAGACARGPTAGGQPGLAPAGLGLPEAPGACEPDPGALAEGALEHGKGARSHSPGMSCLGGLSAHLQPCPLLRRGHPGGPVLLHTHLFSVP